MSTDTFTSFALHDSLLRGVADAGYTQPTPIQAGTIQHGLDGRDVLGLAQTGTGKTAAFVLPILQRLQRSAAPGGRRRVRALVVAPTRELAEQINDEFARLGRHTRLRSASVYGGVGFQPQVQALTGGADVIVACPGRLLDHVERGNADLSGVEVLVLDEADHMFDMGFLPSVRRIVSLVPRGAQRLLFSATMPSEVRHLADSVLSDPATVEIAHSAPASTIDHYLVPADEDAKTDLLFHLLGRPEARSVLVFTRTKHRAKRLAAKLDRAGIAAAELQGNLSQTRRQAALDGFRDGTYDVLVATDIAARGIDVAGVSHVINYDFPDTAEAYTHRIGRTGRAERSGEALTFVTPDDFDNVLDLERMLGRRVTRRRIDGFVPSHADALETLEPRRHGQPRAPKRGRQGHGRPPGRQSNGSQRPTPGPRDGRPATNGQAARPAPERETAARPATAAEPGTPARRRRRRRSRGRRSVQPG